MQFAGSKIPLNTLMPLRTLTNRFLTLKLSEDLVFQSREKYQLLGWTSSNTTTHTSGLENSGQPGLSLALLLLLLSSRFPVKRLLGLRTTSNPTTTKSKEGYFLTIGTLEDSLALTTGYIN